MQDTATHLKEVIRTSKIKIVEKATKEGTRVHVYSGDMKQGLGLGTIEKVEPLVIEELGLTISTTYPSRIVLDSGEVTEGCKCWWIPEEATKRAKRK